MASCVVALATPAFAETPEELAGAGEELAKRGDYAGAIEKFKAADRMAPRVRNACLIGLAYLRRQLYPQAEIFLRRCRTRATEQDPTPEWMAAAEQQLANELAKAPVTAVDLRVKPDGVAATVTVLAFGPDETFDPQPIHLPPGQHLIAISAPGFVTVEKRLALAGRGSQTLEVELVPVTTPQPIVPPPRVVKPALPPPMIARRSNTPSWIAFGTGAVATGGAVTFHVLASLKRSRLRGADTLEEYRSVESAFDKQRIAAISLYAVAGLAIGTGIYLWKRDSAGPQVSASLAPDGGLVTFGWTR